MPSAFVLRLRKLLSGKKRPDAVKGLRARVESLHDLVKQNDRVLELMADAQEKLGGQYIFDRQYLRWLDAELARAVSALVQDLQEIAPGRYAALPRTFQRIRDGLSDIVEMRPTVDTGPLCVDLERAASDAASLLGEKMARLGEIRSRLDIPVPPGFVVTSSAFLRAVHASGIAALIDAAEAPQADLAAVAAQLQARLDGVTLPRSVVRAIKSSLRPFGRRARFAVRSSAIDEDGDLSFAGVHATVLNVSRGHVVEAFRRVIASLFAERALQYRRDHNRPLKGAAMAVGCMRMVPAVASGVLYTFDPGNPASGLMRASATWGYGSSVVEGTAPADLFLLARQPPHQIVDAVIADKTGKLVDGPDVGLRRVAVPAAHRTVPCVGGPLLARLADVSLAIERHMQCPQDIEWSVDEQGGLWILQARPLRLGPAAMMRSEELAAAVDDAPVLLRDAGSVACRGVAAGPVAVVDPATDGAIVPQGSVLLARFPALELSRLLPASAALITDSGTPTSHLATLAREYRVPAIVGTEVATTTLEPGTVVTVDAEENVIYAGRVEALIRRELWRGDSYSDRREFRLLRSMLRSIAPLHLRDPASPRFTAERCSSYHDIIRFAHDRAILALSDLTDLDLRGARRQPARLLLDIPLGLSLVDLGGGVAAAASQTEVELAQVTCMPLTALLEALVAPGVWGTRPADVDLSALMSSVTRSAALTGFGAMDVKRNLAIVSARYMNLSLYLGYHFNVIDCCLAERPEDSYILFRFVGGLSDLARRARRAELLDQILSRHGFAVERTGDMVIARLHGASRHVMRRRLQMVGRLIGFTRQLDVLLRSQEITEKMVDEFMAGGCDPAHAFERDTTATESKTTSP